MCLQAYAIPIPNISKPCLSYSPRTASYLVGTERQLNHGLVEHKQPKKRRVKACEHDRWNTFSYGEKTAMENACNTFTVFLVGG